MVQEQISAAPRSGPVIVPEDEATRYLASAAHLHPQLADTLVEEFLTEPFRVVVPSPGVRADVVLREAVAAQTARRIGNALLLVLLLAFLVLGSGLIVIWLASGLAWRVSARIVARVMRRQNGPDTGRRPARSTPPPWWSTALLWLPLSWIFVLALSFPLTLLLMFGSDESHTSRSRRGDGFGKGFSDSPDLSFTDGLTSFVAIASGFALLLVTVAMYCVLFVQRFLPWVLADRCFQFGFFHPDTPPRPFVSWACRQFAGRLERIAQEERRATHPMPRNVVVYRGNRPFVGAGARVRSWSQAIELHSDDPAAKPDAEIGEFTAADLQNFVAEDVDAIRKSPDITPGGRFAGLTITDTAFVSAGHLRHYADATFFADELTAGRNPLLADTYWHGLLNRSPEWLRLYRCFRVEAWERQLAVAGYLHVGYERRTLYLEWNGFVLPPVAAAYRTVDTPPGATMARSLWRALGEMALLPTTVPSRVADVTTWVRDVLGYGHGLTRTPAQAAHAFGAAATVREIGAGIAFPHFFQEADADQYLKILERRVLDAIQRFLASKGIATGTFTAMVTQINNATVMDGCTVVAGSIGGSGNSGTVGSADVIGTPAAG
ncbi:hypothetical protein [Nocardia sp. NPDC004260]